MIISFLKRFLLHKDGHKQLRVTWSLVDALTTDFLVYVEKDKNMDEASKKIRYEAVIALKNSIETLMKII